MTKKQKYYEKTNHHLPFYGSEQFEAVNEMKQSTSANPENLNLIHKLNKMKKILILVIAVVINNTLQAQTAEKYYELGHKYLLEKKIDSASYYITKSIKANQNYAPPYRDAGQMLFNGKKYDEAYQFLKIYENLTKDKEDDFYYYWYMKGILTLKKDYDEKKAIDNFNKSLKYREDYHKTHKELIDLLVFSDPEKAIYHYKRAKELDKNFSVNELDFLNKIIEGYIQAENFTKAFETYERVKELDKNSSANEHDFFERIAQGYLGAKNYAKAIEYYEKIVETKPDNIMVQYKIALIYKDDLKDDKNAEVRLRKILEKAPEEKVVILELAKLLYKNNEINEAIIMFSKINPKYLDFGVESKTYANEEYFLANYYLTLIYIDKKDKQKATETLKNMKNLFGLEYNNLLNNYNKLLDVIKNMP